MNPTRLQELKQLVEKATPKPKPKTGAEPILIGGSFTPTMHVAGCPCDECVETTNQMNSIVFNGDKFRDSLTELISAYEKLQEENERLKQYKENLGNNLVVSTKALEKYMAVVDAARGLKDRSRELANNYEYAENDDYDYWYNRLDEAFKALDSGDK